MKLNMIILSATLALLLFQGLKGSCQKPEINLVEATGYFSEVKDLTDKDNGVLWGKSLWCPLMLIDRNTRQVIANEPDRMGLLKQNNDVYTGIFPAEKIIANSTTDLGGVTWAMVGLPLDADPYQRNSLLIHEMFHLLQPTLGLDVRGGYSNGHMEQMNARIFLKLEWLALEKAVASAGKERERAIKDALTFREYRRSLFPGADTNENKFEKHEGLAEYTGNKLTATSKQELTQHLISEEKSYTKSEGFVRTFGYVSGFFYAFLLDESGKEWKEEIRSVDDLGHLTAKAYSIKLPVDPAATAVTEGKKYNLDEISEMELARKNDNDKLNQLLVERFTNKPIVVFDLEEMHMGFNPAGLKVLEGYGTVYFTITISDNWGVLNVTKGGCLVTDKNEKAIISADGIQPEGTSIEGRGWTLKLKDGWMIEKDGENWIVRRR